MMMAVTGCLGLQIQYSMQAVADETWDHLEFAVVCAIVYYSHFWSDIRCYWLIMQGYRMVDTE